ncbi:MAG: metalloregulator ArsR/SmtB family transcription factor [Saprospiraceae bacterium]|nr:metalloregulator ArsR/SmtB family transcription factor [Saprospiraceae bacterium]
MGITKTHIFTERQNELAEDFKAMAHPARVAIVQFLANAGGCICQDIVAEIGLAQATVSQHLKVLKHAGFIKGQIDGPAVCYCLNYRKCNQFLKLLNNSLGNLNPENCC